MARPEDFVSPERHRCVGSLKSGAARRWTNVRKERVKEAEVDIEPMWRCATGDAKGPRA